MCLTVFYCAILISNIKEQTVCNKSAVINRGDSYPLDQLRYFNFNYKGVLSVFWCQLARLEILLHVIYIMVYFRMTLLSADVNECTSL